jgi:hypothetical protein
MDVMCWCSSIRALFFRLVGEWLHSSLLAITLDSHYSVVVVFFTSSFTQPFSFLRVANLHHIFEHSHLTLEGQRSLNSLKLYKDFLHSILLVQQSTPDLANFTNYTVNSPSHIL